MGLDQQMVFLQSFRLNLLDTPLFFFAVVLATDCLEISHKNPVVQLFNCTY